MKLDKRFAIFVAVLITFSGCKPRTFNADTQSSTSRLEQPAAKPTASALPTAAAVDLRPAGRPSNYDVQFRHVRLYDCGASGAVDTIWRIATSAGTPLATKEQYILGLAAHLKDESTQKSISFSSVSIDSAPAFYAGSAPSPVSYLNPSFEFTDTEIKSKMSFHSSVPDLSADRRYASGGTLWIPWDGSGNSVSVAIATGSTLRGPAYQVIADCTPEHSRVREWMTHCVGRDTSASCPR